MFQGHALAERVSLFLYTVSLAIKIVIFQNLPTSTQAPLASTPNSPFDGNGDGEVRRGRLGRVFPFLLNEVHQQLPNVPKLNPYLTHKPCPLGQITLRWISPYKFTEWLFVLIKTLIVYKVSLGP